MHDLSHAARYAQHLLAICNGRVAEGSPQMILNRQLLLDVFGIDARIYTKEETGIPICNPY